MSSGTHFSSWGEFDFTSIKDEQYWSRISFVREKLDIYLPDPRFREVPPVKPLDSPQTYDDFFTLTFISHGVKILGLYVARDQYLFASKVLDSGAPHPFEKVQGVDFWLPCSDVKEVDLHVSYRSLQGSAIPSYKREDLCAAVTVLARGFDDNNEWGFALATLVGATSDAIKSFGMQSHVCWGLNTTSDVNHVLSERLIRINKNWSSISKSIRSGKFDYGLTYKNENGVEVKEVITKFSAGLILAVINCKDGTKKEKNTRKLERKDQDKRKRDGNEEKEGGGSKKSMGKGDRKTNKRRRKNFPRTRNNYEVVAEDESETLKSPKPFQVGMSSRSICYSSSSSDSSYFSDPDLDSEAISEEYELQKEFLPENPAKELEFQPKAATEEGKDNTIAETKEAASSILEQKEEEIERLIIPAADTKAPKPFSVRMTPRNVHYSSDSDSSDSESYSESNSDTEGDSQGQNMIVPRIEADAKAPKPFSARMTFRNIHYSSDSDSSYSSDSDSDSDSEAIAQVESELQEENSPKDTAKELEFQHNAAPEEDKTPAEPKEALDFDQAKSSTTNLMYGPNAPASSILVKHGTERPGEAGDKDVK